MKKLEIKHLAVYLPYGLKVSDDEAKIATLCALYDDVAYLSYKYNVGEYEFSLHEIQPLLIPLSELTLRQLFGDQMYNRYYSQLFNTDIVFKPGALPQFAFESLVEHHFDVFGLIEAGLALNKLEYNQNH